MSISPQPAYVIGIDFGTQSARTILADAASGRILASAVTPYAHGVMDTRLPSGRPLPPLYALQHPANYLDVLRTSIPQVLSGAGISPQSVAGLGLDFTACTVLPCLRDGTPLCMTDRFSDDPEAYVKLWKHHAAQPEADAINALAKERHEAWLPVFGGRISSEWLLPKLLETLHKSPAVFDAAERYLEAADWLSFMLTGQETRSAAFAGYKACWQAGAGYPSDEFLTRLDPRLHGVVGTKICENVLPVGGCAGHLDARGAELTGLCMGTPVALPMVDGHAAMPGLGLTGAGDMMMILGTSTCHIVNSTEGHAVPGICGYVKDGVIPGLYTYEAGQAAVGDIFDWFTKTSVPAAYAEEAAARDMSIHALLREKASKLKPGESGLVALDWFNGNRSVLGSSSLTGLIMGLTLRTRPEEIYRALIEATAFGTRRIFEQYEANGIPVRRVCAAGGIAAKDPMLMQIYADVTGREISVSGQTEASAVGSAVYAAVAAGVYPTVAEAARAFSVPDRAVYRPVPADQAVYDRLYRIYLTLHDRFGTEPDRLMETLGGIRDHCLADNE